MALRAAGPLQAATPRYTPRHGSTFRCGVLRGAGGIAWSSRTCCRTCPCWYAS